MRSRRLVMVAAALAVVVGAAGCGGAGGPVPSSTSSPTASPTPGPSLTTATPAPPASPSPSDVPNPPPTTAPPEPPSASPPAPAPPPPPEPPPSSSGVPDALAGVDWERIPTSSPVVALTFDGGASDAGVASILGTLASRGVPATFFVTGDFARRYPDRVAAIAAAGHRLGNHSDTHAHYPALLNVEITADLARAEGAIAAAAGEGAKPLFRFPYGDRTSADIRAVNAAGYVPVRWTVDTLGWAGTERGISADVVVQRVLDTLTPGQIVLMHVGANPDDGTTFDADALPRVIDELRARGYTFVTLDALLG